MASKSKFELSSISPDGPYPSGQQTSYPTSMDMSGSFCEALDNRPSAPPGMIRSGSALSHSEMMIFFQSLLCEAKTAAAEQKLPQQGELKRVLMSALGFSPSDSISGTLVGKSLQVSSLEELRRVKATLHENSAKASDRSKTWDDAISKIEKYQNIVSKKRSRSDLSSSECSNSSVLGDQSVPGGTVSKMVSQSHLSSSGFELGPQKSEDKAKKAVPKKRVRTSMADMRREGQANILSRPSGPIERGRDMLKLVNGGAIQSEEKGQTLATGVEGWEKLKTRKKRSRIKSGVSANAVLSRPLDGDQEPKRFIQQRLGVDARSRLNNAHGFRLVPSNGTVGVGKLDVTSHQNSLGVRAATTKGDQENSSLPSDKRDRPVISDKDMVTLKASNKEITHDDNNAASPISIVKSSAPVRAPRSSSGAFPKLSPNVHRTIGSLDDCEHSQGVNKLNATVGANNRKRSTSMQSSSPQWVGQRPQKVSRVARRTSLVPVVSRLAEAPMTESVASLVSADNGLGFPRCLTSNTNEVKLKGDSMLLACQSESEESEVAENKSSDKEKKSVEGHEKVESIGTPAFPRKNKVAADEDMGHVVRRKGRTGRGFAPTRTPGLDKSENSASAKQLRSARLGSEKIESKASRLPTKKMSDRKQHARPRQSASEFTGESKDDCDELLAAANAVLDASHACSSLFWKQVEPMFGFVSVEDIAFLKQQILLVNDSALYILVPGNPDLNSKGDLGSSTPFFCRDNGTTIDDGPTISNSNGLNISEEDRRFASNGNHAQTLIDTSESRLGDHHLIPLSLRIVASAIDNMEEVYCETYDPFGPLDLEDGLKPHTLIRQSLEKIPAVGRVVSHGYRVDSTGRYTDELEFGEPRCDYAARGSSVEVVANCELVQNGLQPEEAVVSGMICTELGYQQMGFDARILLELQSIGVSPEPLVDDDINDEIRRLEEKLHGQIMEKKSMLMKLEGAVVEAWEVQERSIGQLALDKLIGIAYRKYMSCWGLNASHVKRMSNKITKRIVLAFVKRALARCQKFEETGKSCFSELAFKNMFLALSSNSKDTGCVNLTTDGNAANPDSDMPAQPAEIKTSAHLGSGITCLSSQTPKYTADADDGHCSVVSQSANHLPEQTFAKQGQWPNRSKQRELLLHDVGSAAGTSLRTTSGFRSSLVNRTKGKRSERDRDGKGHNRDVSRNASAKVGRPSLSHGKGERKSKAKPKQRTTQLSASVSSPIGKASEQSKVTLPPVAKSWEMTIDGNTKDKDESRLEPNDPEALDLSQSLLPGMDDLDGQTQDFGTWLNSFDVEGLQDQDFMGLDIPMDDLSELNMMV